KVYDALAGRYGFGRSRLLSREETVEHLPTIETDGLRGGVVYHDGQFDDTRLLVHLLVTAAEQGACVLNYVRVSGLVKNASGFVTGVRAEDLEGGAEFEAAARVVVNATGVFTDAVRRMDDPQARAMIRPSQGVHLVLPRAFHPGDAAIMVPHTDDGRVLFAVPWHEVVVVGTTDTPVDEASLEPRPLEEEVAFLLEHAARYLTRDPTPADVLSVFAGLRPLVSAGDADDDTAALSRDHTLQIAPSGLVTITGGKWTTYRRMAEDTVDHAAVCGELEPRECVTRELRVHGYHAHAERFGRRAYYGTDATEIETLEDADPEMAEPVHPRLPYTRAEVVWAAREEMARTVEDVLARRTRALLLDARAAAEAAPGVAALLADELGRDSDWAERQVNDFRALAEGYLVR
ncbi:MAG: FAD-dependent oxidoreductase, partial [Gemmatimonadetes bacterium]